MIFYLSIYAVGFFLFSCTSDKNCRVISNRIVFFLACLFLLFLAGFRYDVGSDYWSYHYMFYHEKSRKYMERGFAFLIDFYKQLFVSDSYNGFVFFIAFISVGLKYFYFRKLENPFLALLIYLSLYFMNIETNGVRQGLTVALIFFAVDCWKTRNPAFFVYVLIATSIHVSSVLFLPLWLVKKETIKIRTVIVLTVFVTGVRLFLFNHIFNLLVFIVSYGVPELESLKYYISYGSLTSAEFNGILKRLAICVLFVILNNNKREVKSIYFKLYLLSFWSYIIFLGNHQLAHRMALVFDVFAIPLFADLKIKYTARNTALVGCLLLVLFSTYFSSRSGDPNPYQTFLLNQ